MGEGDNAYKADSKKKAIDAYAELGVISYACQAAGISRTTWYEWIANDPDFAQAAKDAEEAAIDALEAEARRRAKSGSDILLMFCMKAKLPEYRDRQQIDLTATTTHELAGVADEELEARVAQLIPKLQAKGLLTSGDK